MRKILIIYLVIFPLIVCAAEYEPLGGYSAEPLNEPIFEYAEVIVETTGINNWLNDNYDSLTVESMKGPREYLYYLITSYASYSLQNNNNILPSQEDLILELLFTWSERLGVYGGSLVYNQVKRADLAPMDELMVVPEGFSLALDNDLFHLTEESNNWSVKFPYYFMIDTIASFEAANGMDTQLVNISTGGAKDNTASEQSQATLMLMHSPSSDFNDFSEFWLNLLEITPDMPSLVLGVNDLSSKYSYDDTLLHKEITFWSTENGSFAVAYLGMDGTYQVNRQHFLDFLVQLKVK